MLAEHDTLADLIADGAFHPRVDEFLNRTYRAKNQSHRFYAKTKNTRGVETAEEELAIWVERLHLRAFAGSLQGIAEGVLAVAAVRPAAFVNVTDCCQLLFPMYRERPDRSHTFAIFNPEPLDYPWPDAEGAEIFCPRGVLGLQAIILETGHQYGELTSRMNLVLPTRGTGYDNPKKGELVFVEVEANGTTHGATFTNPTISSGEGEGEGEDRKVKEFQDDFVLLKDILGIEKLANLRYQTAGMDAARALGFPGAEDFLALTFPHLAAYLHDYAKIVREARR